MTATKQAELTESVTVRPMDDRVALKLIEREKVTDGGIHIPDSAKDRPERGIVVGVGPGAVSKKTGERLPMDVEVGDEVVFKRYSTDKVHVGREASVWLVKQDNIMGIVERDGS